MDWINGSYIYYRGPVLVPKGYRLVEPDEAVVAHMDTGCQLVWRNGRWLHRAACPCWKKRF